MLSWLEKLLGGWLTKQLDRLVSFIWSKAKSWWKGREHLSEVEKYAKLIEQITEKAKKEVEEFGRVSEETEKELALALERRNRGIPFDDHYKLQDDPRN